MKASAKRGREEEVEDEVERVFFVHSSLSLSCFTLSLSVAPSLTPFDSRHALAGRDDPRDRRVLVRA